MLREKVKVEERIKKTQLELQKCPEGKLIISHNGKYSRWRWSDGHTQTHIPKKERRFAERLAYKKYLTLQLKKLLQEKEAINFYIRHHDSKEMQKEENLIYSSEYSELLAPFFTPLSQELQEWMNSPYEKNNMYTEHLIHKTYSGNLVRSKSEALIDMFLYKNRIPFRYECQLQLGDIYIYPDFTIRHPKTGEVFYWEHFGMMDEQEYCRRACSKIQKYSMNGIIPTINLITTYETKEHPLSAEEVERLVKQYFLN